MTTKFRVNYIKQKDLDLSVLGDKVVEDNNNYKPYNITNLQLYNPLYKKFFSMNENNYNNITFKQKYFFHNLDTVIYNDEKIEKQVFVKFSPLLDPYRYMIGKYENDQYLTTMPNLNSDTSNTHQKILSVNNASYIDSFFCYLSSILLNEYNIPHGIDFYGSFLGLQEKFKLNISIIFLLFIYFKDFIEYLANLIT